MEVASIPDRTLAQRFDALARANHIRLTRAQIKREVKRGERRIDGLLREPPEELESMKVFDLLMTAPKVGRVKANKMLMRTRIAPSKQVGGLSERQRGELLLALGYSVR